MDSNGKQLIKEKVFTYEINGVPITIITPIVQSTNSIGIVKRYGAVSDDNTYNFYPKLVSNAIIGIDGQKIRVHGFKKFSSKNSVDEDTDIACTNLYDIDAVKSADSALITEKANGKFVVFTAFVHNGIKYLFGGTKTVHRIVRLSHIMEDIMICLINSKWEKETSLIYGVCLSFATFYNALSDSEKDDTFDNVLSKSYITGEYEDGMHFIPLARGEKPTIK